MIYLTIDTSILCNIYSYFPFDLDNNVLLGMDSLKI